MRNNGRISQRPVRLNGPAFRLLIIGIAALALIGVPVSAATLATPSQVVPVSNYHSLNAGSYTFFAWKPVPGAGQYVCEVAQKHGSVWDPPGSWTLDRTYDFKMISPGFYRWRVTAWTSGMENSSAPSPWRTFDIKVPSGILPTPIQVGPPAGTTFYHNYPGREILLEWKLVMGADRYVLDIQYYDPASRSWVYESDSPQLTGALPGSLWYEFNGPYQGRWRIKARDSTGVWQDSAPSPWRTFTFHN